MAREPEKSAREIGKAKTEPNAASKKTGNEDNAEAKSATEMLKEQHRGLQSTLAKRSAANTDRNAIVKEFAAAWLPHVVVEQDVLAPALKNAGTDEDKLAAVAIHKDIINWLLADLLSGGSREFGQARLEALAKQFDAHVEGAAAEDHGMFALVTSAETSNPGLNAQMKERYERVKSRFANMDESIGEAIAMLAPRRLSVPSSSQRNRREYEMSRYSNDRDRDEQGRFLSNDERGYSRGGSGRDDNGRFTSEGGGRRSMGRERDDEGRFTSDYGYSRGRYQGDDQHYGARSSGSMGRDRDEEGRFTSEYGSRSRGRYDEDDRYSGRSMGQDRDDEGRLTRRGGSSEGRGTGGWFGDSEGHSEASRRGWESGDHRNSGWYGDSERHSEATRRGWDNPRHGESGWHGDSEGRSEASRRGWESREGGRSPRDEERSQRYDEMQSRGQSRYDDDRGYRSRDDNDRGNGGRGHGGWSGDPEGHSEASRRGWQNRR
ncbi:MAG: hypothetical protein WCF81_10735 [Roseiarcus sp.]